MNNDNDLNLHSMTKLSGWLRYCLVVFPFFSTQTCSFFFNKGEDWFAALTNIAILKTQNYWWEMIT